MPALPMHILDFRCFISKPDSFKDHLGKKSKPNSGFIDPKN